MKLHEFKTLLEANAASQLKLILPDGGSVPVSFHITEVGLVHKTFIDCGGTLRETKVCQLQVWVGEDHDHRLEAGKAAKILEKAKSFLIDDSLIVEIEYEDRLISQYQISNQQMENNAIIFHLAVKHTDCLAKELCGIPAPSLKVSTTCCGKKSGCCS